MKPSKAMTIDLISSSGSIDQKISKETPVKIPVNQDVIMLDDSSPEKTLSSEKKV